MNVASAPSGYGALAFKHACIAEVLTSMTKVLADAAYTACLFVSGEWSDAGVVTCSSRPFYAYVVVPLAHSLPLWFRFMQTIKQYSDTGCRWPYLWQRVQVRSGCDPVRSVQSPLDNPGIRVRVGKRHDVPCDLASRHVVVNVVQVFVQLESLVKFI